MTQLRCTGGEHRLLDCPYIHIANGVYNNWGISCRNGNNIIINLCKFSKTLITINILFKLCVYATLH